MDFAESLAPIQQVGVVSCRSDVMPIYKGMIHRFRNHISQIKSKISDDYWLKRSTFISLIKSIVGRGYVFKREDPIVDHIPIARLTRTDLTYVIMVKNTKNLPIPQDITSLTFTTHL